MPKLYYASPRDLPVSRPQPGVTERVVRGERSWVLIADLDARTVVETHKHEVEHVGVVTRGSVAMVIAGEQRILTAGDTFTVPAGTSHGTRVLEQAAQVVSVSPAR